MAETMMVPRIERFADVRDSFPLDHRIAHQNWTRYPEVPAVSFAVAWNEERLYLRYEVIEDEIVANVTEEQGPVFRDCCVEAFLMPPGSDVYTNIECNILGRCLVARGTGRHGRTPVADSESAVRRRSSYRPGETKPTDGRYRWGVTLDVSLAVFAIAVPRDLTGQTWRANFYKCGDALTRPHYLSWSPIDWATPDFHRPEFFGEIVFAR